MIKGYWALWGILGFYDTVPFTGYYGVLEKGSLIILKIGALIIRTGFGGALIY